MNERWSDKVGDIVTLSKSVSEADIALFELISRNDAFVAEDPTPPVRRPRRMAPYPLLASLLAMAASHPFSQLEQVCFLRQQIEFSSPIYTDDTLSMAVEVIAYDEVAHLISISVTCQNQDQRRLAQGEFALDVGATQESPNNS